MTSAASLTAIQAIADKNAAELLDLLLDSINGPLVDESTATFDIIGPVLRQPHIQRFIAGHIALLLNQQLSLKELAKSEGSDASSSNGRTSAFGAEDAGSSPAEAARSEVTK